MARICEVAAVGEKAMMSFEFYQASLNITSFAAMHIYCLGLPRS